MKREITDTLCGLDAEPRLYLSSRFLVRMSLSVQDTDLSRIDYTAGTYCSGHGRQLCLCRMVVGLESASPGVRNTQAGRGRCNLIVFMRAGPLLPESDLCSFKRSFCVSQSESTVGHERFGKNMTEGLDRGNLAFCGRSSLLPTETSY